MNSCIRYKQTTQLNHTTTTQFDMYVYVVYLVNHRIVHLYVWFVSMCLCCIRPNKSYVVVILNTILLYYTVKIGFSRTIQNTTQLYHKTYFSVITYTILLNSTIPNTYHNNASQQYHKIQLSNTIQKTTQLYHTKYDLVKPYELRLSKTIQNTTQLYHAKYDLVKPYKIRLSKTIQNTTKEYHTKYDLVKPCKIRLS